MASRLKLLEKELAILHPAAFVVVLNRSMNYVSGMPSVNYVPLMYQTCISIPIALYKDRGIFVAFIEKFWIIYVTGSLKCKSRI